MNRVAQSTSGGVSLGYVSPVVAGADLSTHSPSTGPGSGSGGVGAGSGDRGNPFHGDI